MHLQGTPPNLAHVIQCVSVEIIGRAEVPQPPHLGPVFQMWWTQILVTNALFESNGARSCLPSAGSLHPASCHHQGCVHGLLFSGCQDLATTLSTQPLWQRLLEVTRLVSFWDKFSFQLVHPVKNQQSPRYPWLALSGLVYTLWAIVALTPGTQWPECWHSLKNHQMSEGSKEGYIVNTSKTVCRD